MFTDRFLCWDILLNLRNLTDSLFILSCLGSFKFKLATPSAGITPSLFLASAQVIDWILTHMPIISLTNYLQPFTWRVCSLQSTLSQFLQYR